VGRGQPLAGVQQLGADQTHREVAVAEPEPRLAAAGRECVHHVPRVARDAVAALVDGVGEPVGHEVRVRRDVHAVDLRVVGGVRDHDELVGRVEHPARELCAPCPAREDRYQSSSGSPVSLMPACVL
jgi:hypothetical protein